MTAATESCPAEQQGTPPPMPFIPVRKSELVSALAKDGLSPGQSRDFNTLCTFIGAYFHHDFYDELTELKEAYALFASSEPQTLSREIFDRTEAYLTLSATFEGVLKRANFIELTASQVEHLGGEHPLLDVKTRTPLDIYETVRIFYRGLKTELVTQPSRLAKKKQVLQDVFDDVVVFVRFKSGELNPGKNQRSRKLPGGTSAGSILIKSFRNIARSELPMLLPEVQVVMSRKDAIFLGSPALIGGIPVALNIIPALSMVLVVIGAYLGFSGEVSQDKLMKAVGALSALVGAGAFMFRQYSNYSFRKLKYQKRLADNIYFKNVNNNSGVFETLIGAAEEQEVKEVILAYHALLTAGPAANTGELDRRIESWFKEKFGGEIDFEVSDALNKLEGLGFLTQIDTKIAVCPLDGALSRLDMLWDRLYDFSTGDAAKQTAIRA